MIGFRVKLEFVWGFQARVAGLSKTNPSFYYPPPTTFLGALAESIARKNCLGERKGLAIIPALSEKLLAIGFRPMNFIPIKYEDINRILAVKITSGRLYPSPVDLSRSFDSPARGKTITMSIDDNPPRMEFVIILHDNELRIGQERILVDEDYFWGIKRIGSKESIVSVIDVSGIKKIDVLRNGSVNTTYCVPYCDSLKGFQEIEKMWRREMYVDPFNVRVYSRHDNPVRNYIEGRKVVPFLIPIMYRHSPPEVNVKLSGNIVAYKVDGEYVVGRGV